MNQALEAKGAREIAALLFGAYVAPDERGANDASFFVEKHCAMHLAGEANASDVFAGKIRVRKRFANRDAGGAPPIFRLLLCPTYLRSREGLMICRSG